MGEAVFFIVSTPETKLRRLRELALWGLESGENLLIFSPGEKATEYVDRYLWSFSPLSFLPHEVSAAPSRSPVVITETLENWNQAKALLNLSPQPVKNPEKFDRIFEFLPGKNQEREQFFEKLGMKATYLEDQAPFTLP